MFSYYGSKSKIVRLYPRPKHKKIKEPFAGSARYSLEWFENEVTLVDTYPVVIEVWHYLQQASKEDILKLPNLKHGDRISNYKQLSGVEKNFLGFLVVGGLESPRDNVGSFKGINVARDLKRIAGNLYKIKHWNIILGSYEEICNEQATWFIDPPYQFGGEKYIKNNKNMNYENLAKWCISRKGQVIVCENTKANWMQFAPLLQGGKVRSRQGSFKRTTEAIWCNDTYPRQMELFE